MKKKYDVFESGRATGQSVEAPSLQEALGSALKTWPHLLTRCQVKEQPPAIAGLTPAEHEEWVEEAHGKNPEPLTYAETAQLLRAKLDRSEFLALQELLDGDADHSLCEEISKLAAETAPELFTGPRNWTAEEILRQEG